MKIRLPTITKIPVLITLSLLLITLSLLFVTPAHAQITRDKYMHVSASAVTGVFLAQNKPFCKWKKWQRAVFNVIVIGGGKEWYDARHPDKHSADWGDIAADAAGAVGAEGMMWLVHKEW
jgi:uncharacterized protein YfiM (DUF2279 family)